MFYDAVCKMLVHKSFEDHHYGPSRLDNGAPPKVPRASTRLDWTNAKHSLNLPSANDAIGSISKRKRYVKRLFPASLGVVNTILEEETEHIRHPAEKEIAQERIPSAIPPGQH